MFLLVVITVWATCTYLFLRAWLKSHHISSFRVRSTLSEVSRHLSLEEWDLAASKLIPLLENKKGGKRAEFYHIQILRCQKDYKTALKKVQHAQLLYPDELKVLLEKGKILLALKQPKKALETLRCCKNIFRTEGDYLAFASAYLECGFPSECLEILTPWLKEECGYECFELGAKAFFAQKNYAQAIDCAKKALAEGPQSHSLHILLGNAYLKHGNLTLASHLFQKLFEKDSLDVAALLGLGACMQERGEHAKALLLYQSGKAWDNKDPRVFYQAGICALKTQKYSYALHYFQEVFQLQKDVRTAAYVGFCLEKLEKWQEAEQHYLRMIQQFPNKYHGYRALAWLFGVGNTKTLSDSQGMDFARISLKILPDKMAMEILSACYSRCGAFNQAMDIQRQLSLSDKENECARRQQVMRQLRKEAPLHNGLIEHTLVA